MYTVLYVTVCMHLARQVHVGRFPAETYQKLYFDGREVAPDFIF